MNNSVNNIVPFKSKHSLSIFLLDDFTNLHQRIRKLCKRTYNHEAIKILTEELGARIDFKNGLLTQSQLLEIKLNTRRILFELLSEGIADVWVNLVINRINFHARTYFYFWKMKQTKHVKNVNWTRITEVILSNKSAIDRQTYTNNKNYKELIKWKTILSSAVKGWVLDLERIKNACIATATSWLLKIGVLLASTIFQIVNCI